MAAGFPKRVMREGEGEGHVEERGEGQGEGENEKGVRGGFGEKKSPKEKLQSLITKPQK